MNSQESALRNYFRKPPSKVKFIIGVVVGILIILSGMYDGQGGCAFFGLLVAGGCGAFLWLEQNKKKEVPTDSQVDTWLQEGIQKLVDQSLSKLSLDPSELKGESLPIKGPILWSVSGIPNDNIAWKIGDDGIVRFGVYQVTIIHLTDRHLAAYACDYNFIRNVALNDRTDEYHYRDVVSVSTKESSSSYQLPTGVSLTLSQEFVLSVASGDKISVGIGISKLGQITGGSDRIPETGAEKAINVIRAMLREKKG
jgi:hypothetical protein